MRCRFIDEHRSQWPVWLMCRLLQVSPGGYSPWRDCSASASQQRREALVVEIHTIHQEFKERYGSPRIHKELRARGQDCCVNTVAKLTRQQGIAAKTKWKSPRQLLGQHADGKFFRVAEERVAPHEDFQTRSETRTSVFEYIEVFYNRVRRHSALGYLSPVEYEQAA